MGPAAAGALFMVSAAVVWVAGIGLVRSTDALAIRFKLGEAFGGLVMLAIATNLPEVAITVSGALRGQTALVVGNLLGGIAIQTVVLVVLDGAGRRGGAALTGSATSRAGLGEATLVVLLLGAVIALSVVSNRIALPNLLPESGIALLWLVGVVVISRFKPTAASDAPAPPSGAAPHALLLFGGSAAATLAAGLGLTVSSEALAADFGLGGAVFGATVLAGATALPEISSGLSAMRRGEADLAIGDILGGNAFLPALLLPAALLAGAPVIAAAGSTDIYLAGLGALLCGLYAIGLRLGRTRRWARLGWDSWAVLIAYVFGIVALLGGSAGG